MNELESLRRGEQCPFTHGLAAHGSTPAVVMGSVGSMLVVATGSGLGIATSGVGSGAVESAA